MKNSLPIIITENLTRAFKDTRAVDSLNLEIEEGEIFGIVGPDGAGKTTALRLLAGLLEISEGTATVAAFDLSSQAESIKSLIGYMAQRFSLYGELTVIENLEFFADIFDVSETERGSRIERLLGFARLTDFKDRRAVHLSGGMQKKLALACTLIHQPKILLLDEPTTGVDPISRREFWDILTELHLSGTTIIVSTPYMDEAERCSRVALMSEGRVIVCDQPRRIREMVQGDLIEIKLDDWRKGAQLIKPIPGVIEVQTYGESLRVFVDRAEDRLPVIRYVLQEHRVGYRSLRQTSTSMEEAFVSLVRRLET
jgi:ABC-2 type transport system ATP-binding protein